MARAIALAERGRGRTTPNPLVGAVVVTAGGVVAGQGAHLAAGGPHAEVVALDAAGAAARGATLYCTLEPCRHVGRTGPCTDRILHAGIARVVTAIEDPNPLVAGAGHALLREAGLDVITGIGADAVRQQMAPFLTWVTGHRPWTLVKTAVSADGFVGAAGPSPLRLTSLATDRWMHRQRAWVDAIAVGSETVLADDPWLTARGAWRARPLTRVVIDWRGRVPPTARVYSTLSAGPVIMVGLSGVPREHVASLRAIGVEPQLLPARDLAALGRALAEREIQSLLIEGGPRLQQAWLDAGLVDAVQYVRTPARLGTGVPAAPALQAWMGRGLGRATTLGEDVLVEGTWS